MRSAGPTYRAGSLTITTLTSALWQQNCYVVTDDVSGESAVIDPGVDAGSVLKATAGAPVVHLLLTHGHYDHLRAANELSRELHAPCRVSAADVTLVKHAPLYAHMFEGGYVPPPTMIRELAAGDPSGLGKSPISLIETPGHTPGSVCFLIGDVLFSGDTLLREAVGRTDLPGGAAGVLSDSIDELLRVVPDGAMILPGHGPAWTMLEARRWHSAHSGADTQATPTGRVDRL